MKEIELENGKALANNRLYFFHYSIFPLCYSRWINTILYVKQSYKASKKVKCLEISFLTEGRCKNTKEKVYLNNVSYAERIKEFAKCVIERKPDVVFVSTIESFFSAPSEKDIREFICDIYNMANDCKCVFIFATQARKVKENDYESGTYYTNRKSLFYEIAQNNGGAMLIGGGVNVYERGIDILINIG